MFLETELLYKKCDPSKYRKGMNSLLRFVVFELYQLYMIII